MYARTSCKTLNDFYYVSNKFDGINKIKKNILTVFDCLILLCNTFKSILVYGAN